MGRGEMVVGGDGIQPVSQPAVADQRCGGMVRRWFVGQTLGITLLLSIIPVGYGWWHTRSFGLIIPYLGGQRLLMEPTEIVLGDASPSDVPIERMIRVVNASP